MSWTDGPMTALHLHTPRGGQVAARVFEPPVDVQSTLQVVIGPAMGVAQRYYADFAAWLAGRGMRVLTFDYRGQADSLALLPGRRVRHVDATLHDWRADYEAVTLHLHALAPGLPLRLIGHSLGAQLPGLFDRTDHIAGLLAVAAGSGYWRQNAPQLRSRALLMWHGLVPVLTPLFGYFPGKRLGAVGDLPAGVIRQWRRWCLHPDYSGAEGPAARSRYAAVRFPIHALSITDDEMMTLPGTQSLLALYAQAPQAIERVAPADHGLARIGHLGWFHRRHRADLWPHALQALHSLPQRVAQAPA
ncbi:alpha/beta hydrolase [Ottowia sp.]|uniref:alpha/beta hydrolase family protein n=1 Tax=Ottowia sp. TaxID=1898956 RepID=UPI002B74870F|nr:alpha/beta hydrolase [Ottowia sp.]HRN75270.1 alpha/beta hydrolase [Ottowia sp.]HRQ02468.1 alpha/beta hydrolase [Ottowia sp.]